MIFQVFNHTGATPLGTVKVVDGTYEQGVDGTDNLSISCLGALNKGSLVRWRDAFGEDHEHLVSESKVSHDSGLAVTNATCINSIADLYGVPLPENLDVVARDNDNPNRILYRIAPFLTSLFAGTKWTFGGIGSNTGIDISQGFGRLTIEDKDDVRTLLTKALEGAYAKNLVIRATYNSSTDSHVVYVYQMYDETNENAVPTKRFTFGKNVDGIERSVSGDTIYSAVKAKGAEIKDANGNGTGTYLWVTVYGSDDLKNAYGYMDANGVMQHRVYYFENSGCNTEEDLRRQAQSQLEEVSKPKVTYTCNLQAIDGAKVGQYVDIVDEGFIPELRVRALVNTVSYKLLEPTRTGKVLIGAAQNTIREAMDKTSTAAKSEIGSSNYNDTTKIDDAEARVSDLEQNKVPYDYYKGDGETVTIDDDGTIHAHTGGGGDNPYINGTTSGVGIFNPGKSDEGNSIFEFMSNTGSASPSSLQGTLSLIGRFAGALKKPFMWLQRFSYGSSNAQAELRLSPPLDDISGSSSPSASSDGSILRLLSTNDGHITRSGTALLSNRFYDAHSSNNVLYGVLNLSGRKLLVGISTSNSSIPTTGPISKGGGMLITPYDSSSSENSGGYSVEVGNEYGWIQFGDKTNGRSVNDILLRSANGSIYIDPSMGGDVYIGSQTLADYIRSVVG